MSIDDIQKKTIMLIPPLELPIPAVGGGAIETLITELLNINENEKKVELIVISKNDKEASAYKYNAARTYYFRDEEYVGKNLRFVGILFLLYRLLYKVFQNRISRRVFRGLPPQMGRILFYCYWIARLNKVDVIVNEGFGNEWQWKPLARLVGEDNIYSHIHYHRKENLDSRRIIPNSISISGFVRSEWAISPEIDGRNVVLYNGVDIGRFCNTVSEQRRRDLRRSFGANDETIIVLFCGRIIKEKGVEQLLDAFALLSDQPIKLLLIGSVAFSVNTTTDFSLRMQSRAKAMDNVIALGYVQNEKMPDMYACADIQVIPSIWQEGAGLVAIEGMASGLPLITTISGGMTEYVSDEVAVQLPIDDELPIRLAGAICDLAKNPEKRREMGEAGRARSELFSQERYYQSFLEAIGCV